MSSGVGEDLTMPELEVSLDSNCSGLRSNVTTFCKLLNELRRYIETNLSMLDRSASDCRDAEAFDSIVKQTQEALQKLQKLVAESVVFLPSYDARKAQNLMDDFQARFRHAQAISKPKQKFAFKTRMAQSDASYLPEIDVGFANDERRAEHDVSAISKPTVANLRGETVVIETARADESVFVSNLVDCRVEILAICGKLHLKQLSGCVVVALPVSTSVVIDSCANCEFVLASQQLRAHDTKCCSFYLHVASRCIIENCAQIRVAPYSVRCSTSKMAALLATAGLPLENVNWTSIDDFNWLGQGLSPNWSVLHESDRKIWEL